MFRTVRSSRSVRWRAALAVVGVAGLVLAACGDDAADPAPVPDEPDEPDAVAVEEFQVEAGGACLAFYGDLLEEFLGAIDPETGEPAADDEEALNQRAIELSDRLTSELRAIGPPEGQVDEWAEWVGLLEESIDDLRDHPDGPFLDEPTDPERADRLAELSDELGVPECTGDELPEPSEEATRTLASLFAEGIRAESGGAIDEDEADCIADGLVGEFTVTELFELEDFEDLPPDRQAVFFEVLTACVPAETLAELGQ
jgi:hypothetical protein